MAEALASDEALNAAAFSSALAFFSARSLLSKAFFADTFASSAAFSSSSFFCLAAAARAASASCFLFSAVAISS